MVMGYDDNEIIGVKKHLAQKKNNKSKKTNNSKSAIFLYVRNLN